MKVLLAHNRYLIRGGEDACFEAEVDLLRSRGIDVVTHERDNAAIGSSATPGTALRTIWSRPDHRELRRLLRRERPDVLHLHNTFPLISPAAYYAAAAESVPVVQTLHNYRLTCPTATLYREGRVCEDCLGRWVPWPGVLHGCYRGSRSASAAVAGMLAVHNLLGTWRRRVRVYIALTDFVRNKMLQAGLPARRVVVKPNFIHPDPGYGWENGGYTLFAGRLSPEKGVRVLLKAWRGVGGRMPLKIVGEGPLTGEVAEAARSIPGVEYLGAVDRERVMALMRRAALVMFPSVWYECLPMVILEAFAIGAPVAASDIGSLAGLISDGETGLLFRAGDPAAVTAAVKRTLADPGLPGRLSLTARGEFEDKYTADKNFQMLTDIYRRATEEQPEMEAKD